jgi:hypothetical protein
MSIRPHLLLGVLVLVLAAAAIATAQEATVREASQPASTPTTASAQEGNKSEPAGNGLEPTASPPTAPLRAADVKPMSWGNVKALWG